MVAGHLQEKNGYFYAVLSYKDTNGKRKTKWIPTGYLVKGNKKKAEAFLTEQRKAFEIPTEDAPATPDELFADYLERWLQIARGTIAITTYSSYEGMLRTPILPWFREKGVTLKGLTARQIQDFYSAQMKRVKANTVIHYHALLHRALKYAVRTDLIPVNLADKVDRPRKNSFQPGFYDRAEINRLFAAVSGRLIEAPVKLAAFYGLRRSEVLGLKWDAIDFAQGTLTIQHTVTGCNVGGKYTVVARDTTKTKSSRRTLPLTPPIRELLTRLKAQQAENRRLCGDSYIRGYEGYICINEVGRRMQPEYLSRNFCFVLERNGLRRIRFGKRADRRGDHRSSHQQHRQHDQAGHGQRVFEELAHAVAEKGGGFPHGLMLLLFLVRGGRKLVQINLQAQEAFLGQLVFFEFTHSRHPPQSSLIRGSTAL